MKPKGDQNASRNQCTKKIRKRVGPVALMYQGVWEASGTMYFNTNLAGRESHNEKAICQQATPAPTLGGNSQRCGASDYLCGSQQQALAACQTVGYGRLCASSEIESQIGRVCAYMWTSSSTTLGYFVQSGTTGCGSDAGVLNSASSSYAGVGRFNAACCDQATSALTSANVSTC